VWGKCEKPKNGKNVKNLRGKILEKNVEKIGVEKTWINDLEEVKSVEKCQCGKKRDKFPWKNITYLVVVETDESLCTERSDRRSEVQLYTCWTQ
jgi:hypothetical protein